MSTIEEFADRFRTRLIEVISDQRGVGTVEVYRRYMTDAVFHAQMEVVILTAVAALQDLEEGVQVRVGDRTRQQTIFDETTRDLLGWDEHH
jgi:hypothetical protein